MAADSALIFWVSSVDKDFKYYADFFPFLAIESPLV